MYLNYFIFEKEVSVRKVLGWFVAVTFAFVLTACPQLSLPPSKTPLAYRIVAEGLSIGSGSYFSTGDLLIAQSLSGNLLAFDPRTKSIVPYDTPVPEQTEPVVEFREDQLELYLWPVHLSPDPPPSGPLYVAVLDAGTGSLLRKEPLTVSAEILDVWNPYAVARKGDRVYLGAARGQIVVLQEASEGLSHASTLTIEEVYEISGFTEDPYGFAVLKIVPDPGGDDLFVLVESRPDFAGMHHVFRLAADGTTLWSAADYGSPQDIVLVGDRLLYFKPTGAVVLDAGSGTELEHVNISIGECSADSRILHRVAYASEDHLIYAPHGVLETQPAYRWRWTVTDLLSLPVTKCGFRPAVLGGVAYYGSNWALLAVDVESGDPLSLARRSSYSEIQLNAPAFAVGGFIVVPQQDDWRMLFAVYRPVEE